MKRAFTLFTVIIFSNLYAQNIWTEVTTPFGIEDFYADKISLVNQDVLWVHGKSTDNTSESEKWGWSDDAGQTWHTGDFTGIDTTVSSVCSIAGISSTTAYVSICSNIENYKGIFITTDGGQTWTKQTSASFVDNTCPNIVRFWDNQNGIAIGNLIGYPHPVIYQTFNSGINWIRVPSGNIPSILDNEFSYTDDSFIDQDNICFGTNKGRIFVDILGLGNVWIVTDLPYSISNNTQMNRYFAFANNNDGLLSDLSGNLWKTSDGSIS